MDVKVKGIMSCPVSLYGCYELCQPIWMLRQMGHVLCQKGLLYYGKMVMCQPKRGPYIITNGSSVMSDKTACCIMTNRSSVHVLSDKIASYIITNRSSVQVLSANKGPCIMTNGSSVQPTRVLVLCPCIMAWVMYQTKRVLYYDK